MLSPQLASLRASGGGPFRAHLRQAVHVDRDALALDFGRQPLEEVDRTIHILLNRGLGGAVIDLLDLSDGIHAVNYNGVRPRSLGPRVRVVAGGLTATIGSAEARAGIAPVATC